MQTGLIPENAAVFTYGTAITGAVGRNSKTRVPSGTAFLRIRLLRRLLS